jgi:hypothetical protein
MIKIGAVAAPQESNDGQTCDGRSNAQPSSSSEELLEGVARGVHVVSRIDVRELSRDCRVLHPDRDFESGRVTTATAVGGAVGAVSGEDATGLLPPIAQHLACVIIICSARDYIIIVATASKEAAYELDSNIAFDNRSGRTSVREEPRGNNHRDANFRRTLDGAGGDFTIQDRTAVDHAQRSRGALGESERVYERYLNVGAFGLDAHVKNAVGR